MSQQFAKKDYLNFAVFFQASLPTLLLTLRTSKLCFSNLFFWKNPFKMLYFLYQQTHIHAYVCVRCLELPERYAEATLYFLLHRIETAWNSDGNTLSYENIPLFICSNCHFLPLAFISPSDPVIFSLQFSLICLYTNINILICFV